MPKIEVFFDYTCPYCLKGHKLLMELLPAFPDVQIVWRPVEAHPRLEEPHHTPYVDRAVRGGLCVRENGGDERAYAEAVYAAWFDRRESVEDADVLAACAEKAGVSAAWFKQELAAGKYEREQLAANDYAFEQNGVWAVPTFVCGKRRLDAVEGVGVTRAQLERFLKECGG